MPTSARLVLALLAGLAPLGAAERQITNDPTGHILSNAAVWSDDSEVLVFDERPDPAGEVFEGQRIWTVNLRTNEIRTLFQARNAARCGIATWRPKHSEIAFVFGPERPESDGFTYAPSRRQGVIISTKGPRQWLDARNLVPPFTPGALRGGTHLYNFDSTGEWFSCTYDDQVLTAAAAGGQAEIATRMVAVGFPRITRVPPGRRNNDGSFATCVVTRIHDAPKPGSDQISRACEEAWIGPGHRSLAFLGDVVDSKGRKVTEVFRLDLPASLDLTADVVGTPLTRPQPPSGVFQKRLTFTSKRTFPGVQGPRHWPRSSPDGSIIACLMKDEAGVVQIWIVSPEGGDLTQLTHNTTDISSAFTWTPDGRHIAHVMDGSVCLTKLADGTTARLTEKVDGPSAPRPEACVVSPDGKSIAYVRTLKDASGSHNQIFVVPTAR